MKHLALVLCLLAPAIAVGEIYKWIDKDGQVHYGERPDGESAQEIVIPERSIHPDEVTGDEQLRRENIKKWVDARQRERQMDNQRKAELNRQKAQREMECAKLKNELRDMEQGGINWYFLDDVGNRQYYSDGELENYKQNMRERIRVNCG